VRGHADAGTLAAFHEELLSSRKAGRVSAHLAGCPRCAALDAQLAEVTSLLSHTSAPPMPDALTARIEAALAAEVAARAATGSVPAGDVSPRAVPATAPGIAAPGTDGGPGGHGTAARRAGRPARERSWLALRVAAVTAAVAVIAGGGYGLARLLSPARPAATSAVGGAAVPGIRSSRTMPRMAGGFGSASAGTSHAAQSVPNGTATVPVVHSGTNYQPGQVGAQASAVLTRFGTERSAAPAPGPSAVRLPHQSGSAFGAITACVARLSRNQAPLLVDIASYRGQPAAVLILKGNGTGPASALVIAPGCTATKARILTTAPLPVSG
jgi:hypothetical protein